MENNIIRAWDTPRGGRTGKPRATQVKLCNICGEKFSAPGANILFCEGCRESNDVFRYSEWMPEVEWNDSEFSDRNRAA